MRLLPLTLALSLFLAACGDRTSPTDPSQRCGTLTVFSAEAYYSERPEPEREFSGTLLFRDLPSTPNGRDHRYFLNGTAVYSGGFMSEPIFRAAAGSDVTIRGKLV